MHEGHAARHRKGTRIRRTALGAVLSLIAAALLAITVGVAPAGATHARATQMTWHQVSGNTVEFHVTGSWRCTFFFAACTSGSPPPAGATFITGGQLHFGDGNTLFNPQFEVVSVDTANDVLTGEAHITHTYPGAGPFDVTLADCCRLSPPGHINNPDDNIWVTTIVNLNATSASPESSVAPIVDCKLNTVCQFTVPAVDPDGHNLRYRMATPAEAGGAGFNQPGPPHAPNAASIDPITGVYHWNTTGAQLNPDPGGASFYSTQVIVEELVGGVVVSKTAVDFFIRLTNDPNQQPVFVPPTPADGTVYNVFVGDTVSFNTEATDPDANDTVTLGIINAPAGSTYPTNSGNPATGSFSWTPNAPGSVVFNLTAQDQSGLGATPRSITINVQQQSRLIGVNDVSVNEGNVGTTPMTFTVSLDSPAVQPVSVDYSTNDGSATAPSDYVADTGTVTFAVGEQEKKVTIDVNGDLTNEPDESFFLLLSNAVGGVIDDHAGLGTIIDDDRNGAFYCRATGVRLGGELVVANEPGTPCVDDADSALNLLVGGLTAAVVHATTDQTPDALIAPPADGDQAAAHADATDVFLKLNSVAGIRIKAVTSDASATCANGSPVLTGLSSVAGLKIGNARPRPLIKFYTRINVPGLASLELNKRTIVDGKVVQQAVVIRLLNGNQIVIGESIAGASGNPCTT